MYIYTYIYISTDSAEVFDKDVNRNLQKRPTKETYKHEKDQQKQSIDDSARIKMHLDIWGGYDQ